MAGARGADLALLGLLFLLGTALLLAYVRAFAASDEVDYMLLARSFAEEGRLDVATPHDELASPAWAIGNLSVRGTGTEARVLSAYPPLYGVLVSPFFLAFGLAGLFAVNVLAFLGTTALVQRMGARLTSSPWLGVLGAAAFAGATFSLSHAARLWPQALSVLLVVAAARPFFGSWPASRRALFLAGVAAGTAVGVRYVNGALLAVLGAWLLGAPRDRLIAFASGALLPLALVLGLNARLHGHPLMTGYGSLVDPRGTLPLLAAVLLAAVAIGWRLGWRLPERSPVDLRLLAAVLAVAAVAAALALPSARTSARVLYAEVVDMRSFPPPLIPSVYKKALLQSCPFLAVAGLGLVLGRRQGCAPRPLTLCAALAATQVLVYATHRFGGWSAFHGGINSLNMRYHLEALPFLVLLCLPVARELYPDARSRVRAAIGVFACVVVIAPLAADHERLYPLPWAFTNLPLALAAMLLVAALALLARPAARGPRLAFAVLLVPAVAYSVVASVADTLVTHVTLRASRALADEVRRRAGAGSLVVVCGKPRAADVAPLVLEGLEVADACIDRGRSLGALLARHEAAGRAVYFLDGGDVPGWPEAAERVRRSRPPGTSGWIRVGSPDPTRLAPRRRIGPGSG
jgi:hypothetical protein